jgi:hypothetical protein
MRIPITRPPSAGPGLRSFASAARPRRLGGSACLGRLSVHGMAGLGYARTSGGGPRSCGPPLGDRIISQHTEHQSSRHMVTQCPVSPLCACTGPTHGTLMARLPGLESSARARGAPRNVGLWAPHASHHRGPLLESRLARPAACRCLCCLRARPNTPWPCCEAWVLLEKAVASCRRNAKQPQDARSPCLLLVGLCKSWYRGPTVDLDCPWS